MELTVRTRDGGCYGRTRGVGTRGGRGAGGAIGDGHDARPDGVALKRPSLPEPLAIAMIENLPRGTGLETPLHVKRSRVLPTATFSNINLSEWDSLGPQSQAGSSSQQIDSSGVMSPTRLMEEMAHLPLEVKLEATSPAFKGSGVMTPTGSVHAMPSPWSLEVEVEVEEAPSPALYVECSGSENSTPRVVRVGRGAKLSLFYSQRLQCDEIMEHLYYGSEEEEETDQEESALPVPIPKSLRSLFEDDEDNQEESTSAELSFTWPPPSTSTSKDSEAVAPPASIASSAPIALPASSALPASITSPEVQTAGPSSKFDFQWRAFTQPQIAPNLRREPFSQINCGPTSPYASPYDVFIDIWDRQIMENIVIETNRYAQQLTVTMMSLGTLCPNSRVTKWFDTTVDELYVFFAITIATGIVVKTRIEEYWTSSQDLFSTPHFKTAMKLDRFLLLQRCLHFQNNQNFNPLTMDRTKAKLFKVQPILDHLNYKFSNLYVLDQNISLDESLTMWKGWLDINQFIKNKAAAVGIKTYEACESRTGYLWRFEVHAGHDESNQLADDPVSGIVPSLVLRLLNGLEHRGHTLWMDNFYNSPALARELKSRGFDCVGTLRTNRQFVPVELTQLKKLDMAVGHICGCTSGDVDIMVWRDKNRVALISTYHGLATVNFGDKLLPTAIADYNICMGGVDRKDQMLAMFPLERKRMNAWYKKLFRRLLNVSVLNAYILYKAQHSTTHRSFRKTLVKELLARHNQTKPTVTHEEAVSNTQGFKHYPKQYMTTEANKANRCRRNCAECGKRVTTYCHGCDKPLCVFTCFEPYHTTQNRSTTQ